MAKLMEKIKNLFRLKKKSTLSGEGKESAPQQKEPKTEQKTEEQK